MVNMRIRSVLQSGNPALMRGQIDACPVFSPLKRLEQVNLGTPNHTRDILSHSLSVFENAARSSVSIGFTSNQRTASSYRDFFASTIDSSSGNTCRDLVLFAALVHDVGMGMQMEGPGGSFLPVVRWDDESGRLIARGHAAVGAEASRSMALGVGFSDAESAYVSLLVKNHMAAGGIKHIFQDAEMIGYHKKVGWDMGAPFLSLCDQQGLDARDSQQEILLRTLIDYPFSFHFPFCAAEMSLLEKLEGVHKRHKQIYVPFDGTRDMFTEALAKDHRSFIENQIGELRAGEQQVCADEEEDIERFGLQISRLKRELSDTDSLFKRTVRAEQRVSLFPQRGFLESIEDQYFSGFRVNLPVIVF